MQSLRQPRRRAAAMAAIREDPGMRPFPPARPARWRRWRASGKIRFLQAFVATGLRSGHHAAARHAAAISGKAAVR